jgi:hypothetical protein
MHFGESREYNWQWGNFPNIKYMALILHFQAGSGSERQGQTNEM